VSAPPTSFAWMSELSALDAGGGGGADSEEAEPDNMIESDISAG